MPKQIRGLLTAFRTLTIISWPGKEDMNLSNSLPWFPVVGLVIGLFLFLVAGVWTVIFSSTWTAGGSIILLLSSVWISRGLHLDGLADWADSIGGMLGKEEKLEIMKDSRIGAFGVMALILALMSKWIILERILASGSALWLILIPVISKDMLVELMATMDSARSGSGMAGSFVKGASGGHRAVSHIITFIICGFYGPVGFSLMIIGWIITGIFRRRCHYVFGGITGDLLGTANEFLEIGLLFLCALFGGKILLFTGWNWII